MSASLLDIRGLCVSIRQRGVDHPVLDRISLTLDPGQVMAVVGESGAGKSIIGSAIIGLLPSGARITAGEIRYDGSRIDNLGDRGLRALRGSSIAAIFQDPMTTLNPLITIGDQLEETMLRHMPISRAEAARRAVSWLERVGIAAAARRVDAYPHEFSGGMRQRAVIALALCAEPRLVIADEPTTALDVSIQSQILKLLKDLVAEQALSMILITHDMGVVADIVDSVAVIYAGRVAEVGPVRAVLDTAHHPYTSALMAAIPPLDRRLPVLRQIDGSMARLADLGEECAFRSRCTRAFDRCCQRPVLAEKSLTRSACWLDAAGQLQ